MVANHEGRQSHNPSCGYNPECNSACTKVRKAYGTCCGPCVSPCYTISTARFAADWPDSKSDSLGDC